MGGAERLELGNTSRIHSPCGRSNRLVNEGVHADHGVRSRFGMGVEPSCAAGASTASENGKESQRWYYSRPECVQY